ncbi:MAG: nitrogenase molybdenum-iron protein subunit beta [Nitrospirae bacterium]|nr:nitrogenase molybdenum-iron protein subunit beta [Nitrospirota bacterium]MBF0591126.1 nitrogenase molybdenum-iron protein subunit beta [Nitrospirota bacterium]
MKVTDHNELFKGQDYLRQFEAKREFELPCSTQEISSMMEYSKGKEYMEKNFARSALTINPAKACQPLGAMLCACGFENTMNFVQGSQGCVAYFRSHLSRHFKEPVAAVSSSMTEDAAVFGGLNNMLEGLENTYSLYKPAMIAMSTTCMAEVIGDDLNAYIKQAKEKGCIPQDMLVPFAHTPSFVGSHITGYDNMLKGILSAMTPEKNQERPGAAKNQERPGAVKKAQPTGKINIIPGFDTYTGNIREVKRLLSLMGVSHTVLADTSDAMDSPNTGKYMLYPGGTPLEEAKAAINAKATISLQKFATVKTGEFIREVWGHDFNALPTPIGIRRTDEFLDAISALSGRAIPAAIEDERGRAVDAMIDSHPYIHGKRFAMVGDPDLMLGLISFVMEMGGEPVHVVSTNGDKHFEADAYELLASSPYGANAKPSDCKERSRVYPGKDMWHLRSLMFNDPVDLLIGNSYTKFLWRDTGTPLIRIGFPLFDRHHLHRYPIIGYKGVINLVTWMVNTVLEEMDRKSINGPNFDVIR